MPSASSEDSGTCAETRSCANCGALITSGRRDKRLCGEECRKAVARQRASAWYTENGSRDDVRQRRSEAARRRYEKVIADPALLTRRLQATSDWRSHNQEHMREYGRAYRAANPEPIREKNRRRRARLLMAYVSPVDMEVIWVRDQGVCGICGDEIDLLLDWPHPQSLTQDHVVALADGGTHEPDNVQLAHASCNSRKGAETQRGPKTHLPQPHGRGPSRTGDSTP